jgi:rhamnogalacturonyl hydrolase YesR
MTNLQVQDSIYGKTGADIDAALHGLSNRYVAEHPAQPYVYRAFNRAGIQRAEDFRYRFNLDERFPEAQPGQHSYAWGKVWSEVSGAELQWSVTAYCPLEIFVNGRSIYRSLPHEENERQTKGCSSVLGQGWNDVVLKFTKTRAGFGGAFGTSNTKWVIYHSVIASKEREGQEGWLFSELIQQTLAVEQLPRAGQSEIGNSLNWYPRLGWQAKEQAVSSFSRLFGAGLGRTGFAWTRLHHPAVGGDCRIKGFAASAMTVFIDGQQIYHTDQPGEFDVPIELSFGEHSLIIRQTAASEWGVDAAIWSGDRILPFSSPIEVKGGFGNWLYLGPFAENHVPEIGQLNELYRVFEDGEHGAYWRIDAPGTWVRPYMEAPLFGKWNYPLGVTLYGLLEAGRKLKRNELVRYVSDHVGQSTSWYSYMKWDQRQYGAPGILHPIAHIDSLDDCGSFGSIMLEALKDHSELPGAERLAHEIGRYMAQVQERLPDGAFYREHPHGANTLWADDLYMAVPFLCRYYQLTGDESYVTEAAKQFLLYKKYLFMPQSGMMSHVFDFKQRLATEVPWGRGNGWVLFSLSELLAVLPEEHFLRGELLGMFQALSASYLAYQSEEGLWRQIIDEKDAYLETSCTAMFIYAYSRGVRSGWLPEVSAFAESAYRAWEGLTRHSMDAKGNLYGVCRGSGYSFSSHYYKYDLHTQLNDTHGIGIVLLAGVEMHRLLDWLKENENDELIQE